MAYNGAERVSWASCSAFGDGVLPQSRGCANPLRRQHGRVATIAVSPSGELGSSLIWLLQTQLVSIGMTNS
jgi:hypothetical protein